MFRHQSLASKPIGVILILMACLIICQAAAAQELQIGLHIDDVYALSGDTLAYIDVYLDNPTDTLAAFTMHIIMGNPDVMEFRLSDGTSGGVETAGCLTADWEFFTTQSLAGQDHDIKITGFANVDGGDFVPGIPPQTGGRFLRLVVLVYDVPAFVLGTPCALLFSELPSMTNFSDPDGVLLGNIVEGAYDASVVFDNGSLTPLEYYPGDANGDGSIDVGDAVFLISFAFKEGPAPTPLLAGDANCDEEVNVGDAVFIINYAFKGGPAPDCYPTFP